MQQWRDELQDISEAEEQESMPSESPRRRQMKHRSKSPRPEAMKKSKSVMRRIDEKQADFQDRFEK